MDEMNTFVICIKYTNYLKIEIRFSNTLSVLLNPCCCFGFFFVEPVLWYQNILPRRYSWETLVIARHRQVHHHHSAPSSATAYNSQHKRCGTLRSVVLCDNNAHSMWHAMAVDEAGVAHPPLPSPRTPPPPLAAHAHIERSTSSIRANVTLGHLAASIERVPLLPSHTLTLTHTHASVLSTTDDIITSQHIFWELKYSVGLSAQA